MNPKNLLSLALLVVIPFAAVWTFAEVRWAVADPPVLVDAGAPAVAAPDAVFGPAAATVGIEPTQPSPPPDPVSDTGGFISWLSDGFAKGRQTGALFSWGILAAFAVLAAVWQRLKPKGDDKPSTFVAVLACVLGAVALLADIVVGAGHFALVATSVGPVVVAMFISPLVQRGVKAAGQ